MKIGEVEKELGLSRETVRYYEKEGLISPRQHENRYREYSEEDIERLKTIIVLRKIGIGISDIKDIVRGRADLTQIVDNNISVLHQRRDEIDVALTICSDMSEARKGTTGFDPSQYFELFAVRSGEPDSRQ